MEWLYKLFTDPESIAHAILIISLVASLGLALGSIRVFGISLGIGGVLFSGILFGHYGLTVNTHILEFVREFGLILFVYSIGVQVGPGFFASLKRQGLPLNIMAGSIVVLGVIITICLNIFGGIEKPTAVGLYAGAVTNTPALAASQQALKDLVEKDPTLWKKNVSVTQETKPVAPSEVKTDMALSTTATQNTVAQASTVTSVSAMSAEAVNEAEKSAKEDVLKKPSIGYAVAYPFGILGIIFTMILIRFLFRIDPNQEAELFKKLTVKSSNLLRKNLEVKNPNLEGVRVDAIPGLEDSEVVISRIMHKGTVDVAQPDTIIHIGDVLLAVGKKEGLESIQIVIGGESNIDLMKQPSRLITKRLIVTKKSILGKTVDELEFLDKNDVVITRISRSETEFSPNSNVELQFGDAVLCVGTEESIKKVTPELGNSLRQLNHPEVIPVLVGIALGVVLGSIPLAIPNMPVPVKLGLAGGPLVVAIILSRIGRIGSLVWYLPISANFMIRELGITLFLSAVGILAGGKFVETLTKGDGLYWMACAVLITLIPILIVGLVGRYVLKTNYLTLCGVLAGSMTDPPALAFATSIVPTSDACNVSYATVYPLTMLLRVVSAQLLILFFLQ